MIALLDTNLLDVAQDELGIEVGQLLTPRGRHPDKGRKYAIDNGAYSHFDRAGFERLLERQRPHKDRCLFVASPDVVGNARRTLEAFEYWYPRLYTFPVALVIQDGIEDMTIPWHLLSAVFIGGTTKFKLSAAAEAVIRCAQLQAKWVHVGRINMPERYDKFAALGVDSFDGTGLVRDRHKRLVLTRRPALLEIAEAR